MRSKRSTYGTTRRFTAVAILPGAEAADVNNFGKFFVATRPCTVVGIREAHETLCTDVGSTIDVEKLNATDAPGAGDDLCLAPMPVDNTSTNNTTQDPGLTATGAFLILAAGDRLGLVSAGGVTALAGVTITVELEEG